MNLSKQIEKIKNSPESELDLKWFEIEGQANEMFFNKGFPTRIKCNWINEYVMKITLKQYVIAVYLKDSNELLRIHDSLPMHWASLRSSFDKIYPGCKFCG